MNKSLIIVALALLPLALLCGCAGETEKPAESVAAETTATAPQAPLQLVALMPATTTEGTDFNVQPDGTAAIALATENASSTTLLVFGDQTITPVFGNPKLLSATIPKELYAKPGNIKVHLTDGSRVSNELEFVVTAKGAEAQTSTATSSPAPETSTR